VGDHHGQETGLNVTSTPAGKSGLMGTLSC